MQGPSDARATPAAPPGRPSALYAAQIVVIAICPVRGQLHVAATLQADLAPAPADWGPGLPRAWVDHPVDLPSLAMRHLARTTEVPVVAAEVLPPDLHPDTSHGADP